MFDQLVKAGLKKDSSVLEIGCGIGTLTQLMANYLKRGEIHATDISPESISVARKRLADFKRISLEVSDMNGFNAGRTYDFIILADVIEHIPFSEHTELFRTISLHAHPGSVVFLNIPHPKATEYFERTDPSKLQIIDQAVYAGALIAPAEACGLVLSSYRSYSLFQKQSDYVLVIFGVNRDISFSPVSRIRIILRKLWLRLSYLERIMF